MGFEYYNIIMYVQVSYYVYRTPQPESMPSPSLADAVRFNATPNNEP